MQRLDHPVQQIPTRGGRMVERADSQHPRTNTSDKQQIKDLRQMLPVCAHKPEDRLDGGGAPELPRRDRTRSPACEIHPKRRTHPPGFTRPKHTPTTPTTPIPTIPPLNNPQLHAIQMHPRTRRAPRGLRGKQHKTPPMLEVQEHVLRQPPRHDRQMIEAGHRLILPPPRCRAEQRLQIGHPWPRRDTPRRKTAARMVFFAP